VNHRTLGLTVRNFRTLSETKLLPGPLAVMVCPDAAGKSNALHALRFLGDVPREEIGPAPEEHGGFDALAFRGRPEAGVEDLLRRQGRLAGLCVGGGTGPL
jgi:predicted ATPase